MTCPRTFWQGDIKRALNYVKVLPTEGEEALDDRTQPPKFQRTEAAE